jgi:hypothetical protein
MREQLLTVADSMKDRARAALGSRNLILVGLMGAGKSSVGRIVASQNASGRRSRSCPARIKRSAAPTSRKPLTPR